MLAILSSQQIQTLDQQTIAKEPISSLNLMERASQCFATALLQDIDFQSVCVVCGPGNNGGDGLAVARLLAGYKREVQVFIPETASYSIDFKKNLKRLKQTTVKVSSLKELTADQMDDLVVDALFGTGLSRAIEGQYAEIISLINAASARVVSIDLPSGMPHQPDWELRAGNCVMADTVYTFQYPKLSLLLPYSRTFAHSFEVLDIGLFPFEGFCNQFLVEVSDIQSKLKATDRFAHKYSRGSALVCGGSKGKSGSVVLSAEAAFRSGCGVLTAHIPLSVVEPLLHHLPESMYSVSGEDALEQFTAKLSRIDAVGIGPGMGLESNQAKVLEQAFLAEKPLVLDADALRLLAKFDLQNSLPTGSILTPHEGEFRELVGPWTSDLHKLDLLKEFSAKHEVITVLKGAYTVTCDGKCFYFNSTGNPAMATAGSGDVLLGVITAMRASGLDALDAALAGVYIHGLAGDLYAQQQGESMLASDISRHLGLAIKALTKF